jgi:nitroimidazol reductase NimA-like FMN-containing flavoprotein (pyridoxamine 5'-phosphate oxidase superfamily)
MTAGGRTAGVLDGRILEYLENTGIVRIATVTPRGRPHVAPFWFACDGERIVVSTLDNQTVRNLRADPECAVLVDLGTDFRDLRGALIRGRARIYGPGESVPAAVRAPLDEIDRMHAQELTEPEFHRYQTWETRDHVLLEISPESATWFDLGRAEMGRTGAASERPIGPARGQRAAAP